MFDISFEEDWPGDIPAGWWESQLPVLSGGPAASRPARIAVARIGDVTVGYAGFAPGAFTDRGLSYAGRMRYVGSPELARDAQSALLRALADAHR